LTFPGVWPLPKASWSLVLARCGNDEMTEQTRRCASDKEPDAHGHLLCSEARRTWRAHGAKRWAAKQTYSPFEGLMTECPRLCRGMVTDRLAPLSFTVSNRRFARPIEFQPESGPVRGNQHPVRLRLGRLGQRIVIPRESRRHRMAPGST
jgi:hypothetical protein